MATPVNPHKTKRPISFFLMAAVDGLIKYSNHNKTMVTLTRIRFNPNGPVKRGEIFFTTL